MSLRICKILSNQRIFKGLNKKSCHLVVPKLLSQVAREDVASNAKVSQKADRFFTNEDRNCCRSFIENQTSLPAPWETLEQSLRGMKSENIRSTILRTCQILEKGNLAMDYCQYAMDKGEKLSLIETCFLIKALESCEYDFEKYEKLIKAIYDRSHEEIFNIEVVVKQAVGTFCRNKSCLKELYQKYKEGKLHSAGIEKLISVAFDIDEPELAWEMANENPEKCSHLVFDSYLKFCIRLAEKNQFSIDMINDVIDFTKIHKITWRSNNLYDYLQQLTGVLNKSETRDCLWSVDKCNLIKTSLCSSCTYELKPDTVTKEELEELKKNFLKKVVVCYNVNMKTTPKELENFFDFLENCKPYDVVIDGLNVFGVLKHRKFLLTKLFSFFENKGMKILLVGRHHLKKSELYNIVEGRCQTFLTRNDSLDDLFYLYAAMHQGINTYFCTSDFLRDHAKYFNCFTLNTHFRKWQISHQYLLRLSDGMLVQPRYHSDLSQSSIVLDENNKVKEYFWHISNLKFGQSYRIETPAEWICLKAISATSTEKGNSKGQPT